MHQFIAIPRGRCDILFLGVVCNLNRAGILNIVYVLFVDPIFNGPDIGGRY